MKTCLLRSVLFTTHFLLFTAQVFADQTQRLTLEYQVPDTKYGGSDSFYQAFEGNIRLMLSCARQQGKLVVVAHRGGFAPGYPENALATVKRTIKYIPAIIEVDVVASSDGVNYLHHDNLLDRTTTGTGKFNRLPWSQIKELNLRDNGYSRTQQHPLRLEGLINAVKGKGFLMLDLKAPSSNQEVIDQVKGANMLNSTVFIAYNHQQANEIVAYEPQALIALGTPTSEQVKKIAHSKLDNKPYVVLVGDLSRTDPLLNILNQNGHFLLGSTYYGEQPADARLTTDKQIPELDNGAKHGFQLVVSNRPISAFAYLQKNDLALETCRQN